LQFYEGDKAAACKLARLLADIEPEPRDDVVLVFARQNGTARDRLLTETALYCGHKFTYWHFETPIPGGKGYPGECFDLFSGTMTYISLGYLQGKHHYDTIFMAEADGAPTSVDWIDRLKKAHEETLFLGKYVTGPHMRHLNDHINGTCIMDAHFWPDHPSLHHCPSDAGWDCFHGIVLRNNAGPSRIIENLYGMGSMSESVFWTHAREAAWLTSIKDGMGQHWARHFLVDEPKWRHTAERGRLT
jgi:hypothetical protein